jgi:WXG100 family type VII secretion target
MPRSVSDAPASGFGSVNGLNRVVSAGRASDRWIEPHTLASDSVVGIEPSRGSNIMSTRITVTSAELRDTSGQMNAAGGQISAELARLLKRVGDLTGSWTGQASSGFNGYYGQFNQNWSRCEEALKGIANLLASAATSYDEAEAGVAARFQG